MKPVKSCFVNLWADSKKNRVFDYLRFLNSFSPSISVMYSNPTSMSCLASLVFVAVLQVHSLFVVR